MSQRYNKRKANQISNEEKHDEPVLSQQAKRRKVNDDPDSQKNEVKRLRGKSKGKDEEERKMVILVTGDAKDA